MNVAARAEASVAVVPSRTRALTNCSQSDGTLARRAVATTPVPEPAIVLLPIILATAAKVLVVLDSMEYVTPAVEAAGAIVAFRAGTANENSIFSGL